ncbi:putative arabinogalactan oligomer transport system permease protein ganP [Pectobacterium carotovorum subsp. carotovorum PCCS1]|nr:putative arabinogalactan oligomer transport system permease protein ganP [Pectobacterium carotovorum subsp. carotovorum PCCS1]
MEVDVTVNASGLAPQERGRRHARTALLLALVPGLGQIYNRQIVKGAFFFIVMVCFISVFHDFLRDGTWGLITLGTELPRDHSIFLLAKGIISLIVAAFGIGVYYCSLRDAYVCGTRRDKGLPLNSVKKQYQMLLSEGFPYLMITPGFILLVFVVVFPIIFGFSIAFTNYDLYPDYFRFLHRLSQLRPFPHAACQAGRLGRNEELYQHLPARPLALNVL